MIKYFKWCSNGDRVSEISEESFMKIFGNDQLRESRIDNWCDKIFEQFGYAIVDVSHGISEDALTNQTDVFIKIDTINHNSEELHRHRYYNCFLQYFRDERLSSLLS